jgi:F-type H+-transporting ATPase subunit epsilon
MNLRISLPTEIFAQKTEVLRIIAETHEGSFGLLLAVDEGVLVKAGADVRVSVRHAIGGTDLSQLHDAVKREFLMLDEEERNVRAAITKMETGFIGRFAELQHGK